MRIELRRNPQDCKFYTKDGVDITDDLLPYGVKIAPIDARSPGGMESPTVELQCYLDTANVEVLPEDVKVTLLLTPEDVRSEIQKALDQLAVYSPKVEDENLRYTINCLRGIMGYDYIQRGDSPNS